MSSAVAPTSMKYPLHEMLAAIVVSSEDAIIGKILDGIITTWNHGAESLYGYTADEVIGKSIAIIIPEDRREELHYFLEQISKGERVLHHETKRLKKDGTTVDISVSLSPIRDATDTICGAAAIARDITDLIKTRAELQKSNLALNAKVMELEKMNHLMSNRELRMVELKDQIKKLESEPDAD